jgi:dihydroorotate dehydrogenase (NAD+) catalytic subunit
MGVLLSSGKRDILIEPEWTNAAGMLGFSDESFPTIELTRLGAFVTNPVSLLPRTPARPPRVLTFQGGFLLHTGHPNPGFSAILTKHKPRWMELPCPVIVHLMGQEPHELSHMIERLEEVEAVAAIEVGLEAIDPDLVSQITLAAVQSELPVIIQVPLIYDQNLVQLIAEAGPSAIAFGPPRGSLPGPDGGMVSGRLFGPALFPAALQIISIYSSVVDIPIIASGGIYDISQVQAMLAVGASAVQLDSILWTEPERILEAEPK